MPDEVEGEQAEVEAGNQQATSEAVQTNEGAAQGGATSAPNTPSWKVGDTVYTDPNEMYNGFVKWQGDFTRKSQDYSRKEKEYSQKIQTYERAFEIIRSDPSLTELVRAKIQAGMSPQQAVQQTAQQAQIPPEVAEKLSYLEAKEQEREETASLEAFEKSHKDLTDPEWDLMGEWIDKNEDALKDKGWSPSDILEYAFLKTVHPARLQKTALADLAAKQKGEESENGKKSSFLGSQAPTAGAKPTGLPERKRGMTPAEERAYTKTGYQASKSKK
jgi:hypothetical protein